MKCLSRCAVRFGAMAGFERLKEEIIMTNAQKTRFKKALETKRQELVRDIHRHAGDLAIEAGEHDPLDQVQSMNQRDKAGMLVEWLSRSLSNIDASLRAIAQGSYGICVECEEEIGLKRLEAIPWASHCIRCQEILEQGAVTDAPADRLPYGRGSETLSDRRAA